MPEQTPRASTVVQTWPPEPPQRPLGAHEVALDLAVPEHAAARTSATMPVMPVSSARPFMSRRTCPDTGIFLGERKVRRCGRDSTPVPADFMRGCRETLVSSIVGDERLLEATQRRQWRCVEAWRSPRQSHACAVAEGGSCAAPEGRAGAGAQGTGHAGRRARGPGVAADPHRTYASRAEP